MSRFIHYVICFMLRILMALPLLVIANSAQADWFYRFVSYKCDARGDRLVIRYEGAFNEVGEARRDAKHPNEWEPGDLIASMKDDNHIGDLKTIEARCKVPHGTYKVQLGPTPGNYNIQGRCGAVVTAWVKVWRDGKLLLPRYELEGDCHEMSAPVTTRIVFSRKGKPTFQKISPDAFIK